MRAPRLARFSTILVAWTLVGLLSIAPGFLAQLSGDGRPVRYGMVAMNLESVWLWAGLTPLIWWLAARFPVRGRGLARAVGVHFLLANAVNLLDGAIDRAVLPLIGLPQGDTFLAFCRDQLFINVFSYAATVAVGQALAQAAEARRRQLRESELAAELAQAQLRALEMQLRPHFLFNTLHGISALISKQEGPRAIRTIAELGDLLRALLRADGHEATVHEELELTLRYLRIEEMRFGERLVTRVSVTPEALPARVPRLVLQPLVENAVRHGVEATAGPARIELRATVEDDMLWLSVRDDGGAVTRRQGQARMIHGPTEYDRRAASSRRSDEGAYSASVTEERRMGPCRRQGASEASRKDAPQIGGQTTKAHELSGLGIGLANTRARLQRLYGDRHRLELRPVAGGGVEARVGVPFHVGPVELAERDNR